MICGLFAFHSSHMFYTSHSIRPVKWSQVEFNYRWDCETVHTRRRQEDLVTIKFSSILICCCLVICGLFEFHSTHMLYSIRPVKWSQVEFNYRWDSNNLTMRTVCVTTLRRYKCLVRLWYGVSSVITRKSSQQRWNYLSMAGKYWASAAYN